MATDINPDILAQLQRIHSAVNDGTLDRDVVNDALRLLHDFLSGKAYEQPEEKQGEEDEIELDAGVDPEADTHDEPRRRKHPPRRKK